MSKSAGGYSLRGGVRVVKIGEKTEKKVRGRGGGRPPGRKNRTTKQEQANIQLQVAKKAYQDGLKNGIVVKKRDKFSKPKLLSEYSSTHLRSTTLAQNESSYCCFRFFFFLSSEQRLYVYDYISFSDEARRYCEVQCS